MNDNERDSVTPTAPDETAAPPPVDAPDPNETPESVEVTANGAHAAPESAPDRDFEEWTLAEMLAHMVRAPVPTLRALAAVTAPTRGRGFARNRARSERTRLQRQAHARRVMDSPRPVPVHTAPEPAIEDLPPEPSSASEPRIWPAARPLRPLAASPVERRNAAIRLGLYALGVILCMIAFGRVVVRMGSEPLLRPVPFTDALPFLAAAFVLWLTAEIAFRRSPQAPAPASTPDDDLAEPHPVRWPLLGIGAAFAAGTYAFNGGNQFTAIGVLCWLLSIALISFAFAPQGWTPLRSLRSLRASAGAFARNHGGVLVALLIITLIGTAARFYSLDTMLPEMTSDHVEKLLDAQRVSDGIYDVFFMNNGGREAFQFYTLALMNQIPGVDLTFMTLKVLSALESIATIPVMFFLGVAIIGERDRRLGMIVGLMLALLVSVGYWHLAVTRVSLRITMMPLAAALVYITLIHALRRNSTPAFVLTGLALGFSLWVYQAARMLPVVVVVGVLLAIVIQARGWHDRRRYVLNLVVVVIVSLAVFMPMARFAIDFPEDFWRRTSGRLLGDDLITETLDNGTTITREATIGERLDAFGGNVAVLGQNMVNALLMFNYRGDGLWFHNAPDQPAMNAVAGGLFIGGLAAWFVWMLRRRDVAAALVPVALLIMLLPSALSIAIPAENPSHTRTSGALPLAYFLAAFGLGAVVLAIRQIAPRRLGVVAAGALLGIIMTYGYASASAVIFGPYNTMYSLSWHPISYAGDELREFVEDEGGGYGNAFMIAFPHFWDYRAVGIEAGLEPGRWPHGDIALDNLASYMRFTWERGDDDPFRLDPSRPLLFIISPNDDASPVVLSQWFPQGSLERIETSVPGKSLQVYRAPAPGDEAFKAWMATYAN